MIPSMRSPLSPWLARLSFSFLIGCGWLLWEAYRASQGRLGPVSSGRITLFLIGAVVCFVLAIVGVRERHRSDDIDHPE